MKIHEYQAKKLFAEMDVPVPEGIVVKAAQEAGDAYDKLGTKVAVVKSQIHAGGRGKGRFNEHPDQGGVVLVKSREEAIANAEKMLGSTLVTIQTGDEGKQVNTLYVEQGLDIARELYFGIVVDRETGLPCVIASQEGGMAIEEIAEETPEKITRVHYDPAEGLQPFQVRKIAYALDLEGPALKAAGKFFPKICKFFASHTNFFDIGKYIKGTMGTQTANALYLVQAINDYITAFFKFRDHLNNFILRPGDSFHCTVLCKCTSAGIAINLQLSYLLRQVFGHRTVTQTPSSHSICL